MKVLKPVVLYEIEGYIYKLYFSNKDIEIGSIVYDSRYPRFAQIEDKEDLLEMSFQDPELYAVLTPVTHLI